MSGGCPATACCGTSRNPARNTAVCTSNPSLLLSLVGRWASSVLRRILAAGEVLQLKYNRTCARIYVSRVLLCSAAAGSLVSKGDANDFVVHRAGQENQLAVFTC